MKTALPARMTLALALSLGMGMALLSCGGGGSLLGVPTDVVVFQHDAKFSDLERFHVFTTDFTVPESGELHITVDWTQATDDLDLALSNPACDAVALAAELCKVFAREQSNLKPARVTMPTTATAYRLFVVNRGPSTESGTVSVTVTQTRLVP